MRGSISRPCELPADYAPEIMRLARFRPFFGLTLTFTTAAFLAAATDYPIPRDPVSASIAPSPAALPQPPRPPMQNLFRAAVTEAELASLLETHKGIALLPPLGAPEWATAARKAPVAKWLTELRKQADADAFRPMPELTDQLYAVFHETGQRRPFERVYLERRQMLTRIAMVVLLSEEAERRKYLPDLIEKIRELAAEPSWALPAHVGDPSGKDPLALDLLSAETANFMAELVSVFRNEIPDALAGEIKARLRREFFENYVNQHASLKWVRAGMNWNAVCHQGILGAALTTEEDSALVARMLMLAREGLPHFLDGFGDDGSTSEGPGYWQYGFGWFAELNDQLERRTAGTFSLMENDAKVRRIAHFAPHLAFRNGYLVNFSDNERRGILRAPLLAYLGTRLDSASLRAQAASAYRQLATDGIAAHYRRGEFFFISRLVLRCPENPNTEIAGDPKDVFFPNYELVVARGTDALGNHWEFAAKAGSNHEHHNHNDSGSFILHLNGSPVAMEIGNPEYVRDYFNEHRYTFLSARSAGHSLPLVNGCEQSAGQAFDAEVIKCEMTAERVEFVMDLAKCYPAEARCRRLIRSFVLDKRNGRLTVTDDAEFDGTGTLESLFIGDGRIDSDEHGTWIETPAGGRVRLEPGKDTLVSGLDRPEYRNRQGETAAVNRLHLRPRQDTPAASARIDYTLTPAR